MIGTSVESMGFRVPQQKQLQVARLPAPNKGIDNRAALGSMNPDNCIYAFNIVPSEFGMKVRDGYREWQIDVTNLGPSLGVHSMVVFDGVSPSDNRLFAVTNEGIFDVTVAGAAPILKIAFTIDTSAAAGYGVYAHYIEQSGNEILFYADSKNGLFEYTESTGNWTVSTTITGPDLTKVDFVVVHKQRMWLIEQDESKAWYLPVASSTGAATEFFFGSKFPHGGKLKALINWSVDGGAGVDDYLVAVSSSGDVAVYQGADPAVLESPTSVGGWAVVGTYFIGKVVEGKKFFSEYSGELYLLSSFGLIAMSDLLNGVDVKDTAKASLTFPIAGALRQQLVQTGSFYGWEPLFIPSQGSLLIQSPIGVTSGKYVQFNMNLSLEGWGLWRDVPMTAFVEWNDKLYFGTADNRICAMDVPRDNLLLDEMDVAAAGLPIKFSLLTAYSDAGSPGLFKTAEFIRADFLTETEVVYNTKVLYDFSIEESLLPVTPTGSELPGQWDIGLWDSAIWGSGALQSRHRLQGSGGLGRTMAVAIQGEVTNASRYLGVDVMWTSGGPV